MGGWRRIILPIVRVVLVAAIAVALVKIAFFPDASAESTPAEASASIEEPVVTAQVSSLENALTVPASVRADTAVDAKATLQGTVSELTVTVGQKVAAGERIGAVRQETPVDPVTRVAPDGTETVVPQKPKVVAEAIVAPAAGTISALSVIQKQDVAVGDVVATITPDAFVVQGSLKPKDLYRLSSIPGEASVSLKGGPGEFTCTSLRIATPAASGDGSAANGADPSAGAAGGDGASTALTCRVPVEVRVFSGLTGALTIQAGSAENVVTLPTTAVKGNADSGSVWVQNAEGGAEERPVKLGITDGVQIQIVEGIAEGDTVYEFVPGTDVTDPESTGCALQPDGTEVCEDGLVP
ncbi:HlyD family secretion protein [Okibacterium fritillariae]|uniref:HlyD family secretion protein n=2 Tax=Okibacterium fritillariae TaxID=123320 RepID=A0A1T5KLX6_9MICO|nr:HlyD family secretion protein [Okibacterium fritillariae]